MITARATGYYPTTPDDPNHAMEGGSVDMNGDPIFTLDQFLRGEAPYVTVAADKTAFRNGTILASPKFPGVKFRVSDTGGAFRGMGTSRIDIARDNEQLTLDPEINTDIPFEVVDGAINAPTQPARSLAGVNTEALDGIEQLDVATLPALSAIGDETTGTDIDPTTGAEVEPLEAPDDDEEEVEPPKDILVGPNGGLPKPIFKNRDGSVKWDNGITTYDNGVVEQRLESGKILVRKPDGKWQASNPIATKKESDKVIKLKVGGEDRPFVYKNGKMVEVPMSTEAGKSTTSKGESYAKERSGRVLDSVKDLEKRVTRSTTGWGGVLLNKVPETEARDFSAELDTLKSNIAFGELTEMRNASKTGGALGSVSNIELRLLESTLGALDVGQSPENFKKQLAKIRSSLERWEEAKETYADESPQPNPSAAPTPTQTPTPSATPSPSPSAAPQKDEHGFTVGEKRRSRKDGTIAEYIGNGEWRVLP